MIINRNRSCTELRFRALLCGCLFIAAGVGLVGTIGSSRAGGSTSPKAMANLAKGANLSRLSQMRQRVEDNAFHFKIAPWVSEQTANGQRAAFIVVLADQVDLSAAAPLTTKLEKDRYLYEALRNKSNATQTSILQWLRERGIEHRSFYIVNAILVKGSREIAEALAARRDVARVEGNPQIKNILPQPDVITEALSPGQRPETIEPGINYTHRLNPLYETEIHNCVELI
jgi:hypothetical protein